MPSLAELQAHVDSLLTQHQIQADYHPTRTGGLAYIRERRIQVPVLRSIGNYCVILHEIGHIVMGSIKPRYVEEYRAEQFALTLAREQGVSEEELARYENGARYYVLTKLIEAHQRGLDPTRVCPQIQAWVGLDLRQWGGKRPKLVLRSDFSFSVYLAPAT